MNEQHYNWLYLSVWLGLRPKEIDQLHDPNLFRIQKLGKKVSDGISEANQEAISRFGSQEGSEKQEIPSDVASIPVAIKLDRMGSASAGDSRDQNANELISAGITFLEKLSTACQGDPGAALSSMVARDPESGQDYLRLPLPSADAIRSLGSLLQKLGESFQPRPN